MDTNHEPTPPIDDAATRLIDVGSRRLALSCSGDGLPTVVLETGLGADSDEWAAVQRGVARFTRVVRYDRAGRGRSDPAQGPRSARDMVRDLHTLVYRADIPGPYVLVGHSFGGLLARLYAYLHRGDVAGLVLVDSMHEDQFDLFGPRFPPPSPGEPAALRQTRDFWTSGWRDPNSTTEGIDFPASTDQARQIISLNDLPIRVLTAGTFLNQSLVPASHRAGMQELWNELQTQFMELSSNCEHMLVESSGHFMQRDQPAVVIEAIRNVVAQARQPDGQAFAAALRPAVGLNRA